MGGREYLTYCTYNNDVYRSHGNSSSDQKFNNIEEFLIWLFNPVHSEIRKLEATIKQAQLQIEQLKQQI